MSKNESWTIDPATRDYVLDDQGRPLVDDGLRMPIYIRLRTQRSQWLYAPDNLYGSNLYLIKRNVTSGPQTAIVNTIQDAVQPIIDDGRALEIESEVGEVGRSGVEVNIVAQDALGQPENLTFIQLEV